jgi:hypothetical protein
MIVIGLCARDVIVLYASTHLGRYMHHLSAFGGVRQGIMSRSAVVT